MRTRERIAIAIGIGSVVSLAAVGPASAGVIEHQTLKGKAASVEFLKSTPLTCADGSDGSSDLFVSVFGEESLITSHVSGRTLINAVNVIYVVSNSCTGAVSIAIGQIEGGFNAVNSRKVLVNATVPLTDLSTGESAGTLVATLTLVGGSIIGFTTEHDKTVFPDQSFFRTDQVKSKTRPATVTGSLTVNGVQFIGNLSQALMFDNRDSVSEIGR